MAALLTPRQSQLLDFLQRFAEQNGVPPTRAEIASEMGFRSPNAAEEHLKALARKGAIELVPGTSRGIRLRQAGLPLIGRVAAGAPILAEQHIEEYYQIEAGLFYPTADYLLRVRGASMRDAGILDGDLLAVHRSEDAANGQIIVARLEDEVTVKRFRRRGNQVWLMPENPAFEPIKVDLAQQPFHIEGIGVGVIRNGRI